MLKSESYNATICNIVYTELKYSRWEKELKLILFCPWSGI